jgi:hypothetical protein
MKIKFGRPTISGKPKGILIGARFNAEESRAVHKAVERAGKGKSQWVRTVLLKEAGYGTFSSVKIKLTVGELEELRKEPPSNAKKGGFQNFLVKLRYRIDDESGELELDTEDLNRIHRYAFDYKNGGWQTRLKKIFSRTLGDNLSGGQ